MPNNPFDLISEANITDFSLTNGKCTIWESDPLAPPISLIKTSEDWGVTFDWTTDGPWNHSMAGTWNLYCYLEQMGSQEGPDLPPVSVAFDATAALPHNYSGIINIPAGTVTEGLYKITTAVTFQGAGGPAPIAMVGNGPLVKVYLYP